MVRIYRPLASGVPFIGSDPKGARISYEYLATREALDDTRASDQPCLSHLSLQTKSKPPEGIEPSSPVPKTGACFRSATEAKTG